MRVHPFQQHGPFYPSNSGCAHLTGQNTAVHATFEESAIDGLLRLSYSANSEDDLLQHALGGVAQSGRAPALQAGGRRFEPARLHQDLVFSHLALRDERRRSLTDGPL